jgi:hypothetical protein
VRKAAYFENSFAQRFSLLSREQVRKLLFIRAKQLDRPTQNVRAPPLRPLAPLLECFVRGVNRVAGIFHGRARRDIDSLARRGIHHFNKIATARAYPLAAYQHLSHAFSVFLILDQGTCPAIQNLKSKMNYRVITTPFGSR